MPKPARAAQKNRRDRSHLQVVSASEFAEQSVGQPSEFDEAREIALRRLTVAPKSRKALTRDLIKRGVSFDVANDVVNRLAEVGLIDDAAFANAWVSSRHSGRGLARRALRSELRLQGVDDETVTEAVETLTTEDEYSRAKQLVERKLRVAKEIDSEKQLRRLTGMLQRKGYGLNMISAVLKEVMNKPA